MNGTNDTRRRRRTNAQLAALDDAIVDVLAELNPMTLRQVFYRLVSTGAIGKTESDYAAVGRRLRTLRTNGRVHWSWIVDRGRYSRQPSTWNSMADFLDETARLYRRNLWTFADVRVEIWLEKLALAGIVEEITYHYAVPLMIAVGYSSWTYLHQTAEAIMESDKPTKIYYLADWDPSGQDAARYAKDKLTEFCVSSPLRGCEHDLFTFEAIAVIPEQIQQWNLPTRPTKKTDPRTKTWDGGGSVELDAIHPDDLRNLVQHHIEHHLDPDELKYVRTIEAEERNTLKAMASKFKSA